MAADKWEENHESNACYNDDRVRPLDKQSKGKRVSNWWQWTTRKNDCYHSTERMMRNGWRYAPWRFLTGYLGALGDVNSKENWHQVKLDGRRDRAGAWLRQPKAVRCSPSRPHVGQRRCNARMSAAATHTHTHTHTQVKDGDCPPHWGHPINKWTISAPLSAAAIHTFCGIRPVIQCYDAGYQKSIWAIALFFQLA